MQKLQEHVWEPGGTLASRNVSQARGVPSWLSDSGASQRSESEFLSCVPPVYMERSTAGDHEVFEDTDRELQDVVRMEVIWASFGSTSS